MDGDESAELRQKALALSGMAFSTQVNSKNKACESARWKIENSVTASLNHRAGWLVAERLKHACSMNGACTV
jgi:hypothetical protein